MPITTRPRLKAWEKFVIGFAWAAVFALGAFTLFLSTVTLP